METKSFRVIYADDDALVRRASPSCWSPAALRSTNARMATRRPSSARCSVPMPCCSISRCRTSTAAKRRGASASKAMRHGLIALTGRGEGRAAGRRARRFRRVRAQAQQCRDAARRAALFGTGSIRRLIARSARRSGRQAPDPRAEPAELFLDVLVAAIDVVDAVDDRVAAWRRGPASTSEADARRSVAISGAPDIFSTPRTIAALPSSWISAPRRCSSSACMKRFSNTVSVMTPTPSATQLSAVNCACMSVGNAGYGAVVMLTAFGRLPAHVELDPVLAGRDVRAGVLELAEHRVERLRTRALGRDLAAGDRAGDEERAGLDAIGQHFVASCRKAVRRLR